MNEHHYRSNLRDIEFNLFEYLDLGSYALGRGEYEALDEATVREMLRAFERFACEIVAPSFVESDRVPLGFDGEGNVTLPPGIKHALHEWYEQGWDRLQIPAALGGIGATHSMIWAAFEMQSGASPCVPFYQFGSFLVRVIDTLATPSQRARYVNNIIERRWGGTMVLTEPDAGSDVGAGRTRARHIKDDVWEIDGVKRFITNGDYDGTENIVHLVLARPEGHGPGTKGLSMFIVPKFWVNEDGSLGERNGAVCTNVEKKMGLKASATCEMTFGADRPCRGLLVGEVHDGIRQMFAVIEQARMSIGVKSLAHLSTAYLRALEYARERVQGGDLQRIMDKSAPRVRIIEHPDVRRMLMMQKSHAEGMRALCLYTASIQDRVTLAAHGSDEAKNLERLNDLLLPLVKGYCSEKSYELLSLALQVHGGSGYLQDYPIEQYIRDQKIDTLYEGTTHIQALDLLFRKIARDNGATLQQLLGQVRDTLAQQAGGDALARSRQQLASALEHVEAIFGTLLGKMGESLYHVGLHGTRVLFALAELTLGWLLVRHAALALEKLGNAALPAGERAYYEGKVASARFFCAEVLPNLRTARDVIEQGDLSLMNMPEASF